MRCIIIISGRIGSGKTTLARAISEKFSENSCALVSTSRIIGESMGEIKEGIDRSILQRAGRIADETVPQWVADATINGKWVTVVDCVRNRRRECVHRGEEMITIAMTRTKRR